jgi:hypothetical protein
VPVLYEMPDRDFYATVCRSLVDVPKPFRWSIQRKVSDNVRSGAVCADGATEFLGEAEQAVIDAIHDLRREAKRKAKR